MAHAHTERLLDAWRLSRGDRWLPSRSEISPALLGPLLPQVFILGEAEADGAWRFRLSGGFVNDLHGRELRGERFLDLWAPADRAKAAAALERARTGGEPVVLKAVGVAMQDRRLGLELTLAPATGPTEAPDRIVGLLQPTSMVARLGERTLHELRLAPPPGAAPRDDAAPRLRLVVDNTDR